MYKLLLITIWAMLMSHYSFSQNRNHNHGLNLIITTDPLIISNKRAFNIHIGLNYKWLEINVRGFYDAELNRDQTFTVQYMERYIKPSIRFYPFYKFFNSVLQPIHKSFEPRYQPCYAPTKKITIRPNGIYLQTGYFTNSIKYNYIPDESMNSPISEFPFSIRNNGMNAEIGYHLTIWMLAIGVSYGTLFTFPKLEGSIDPFGDSLYTSTFPLKYRLETRIQLQIGINLNFNNK